MADLERLDRLGLEFVYGHRLEVVRQTMRLFLGWIKNLARTAFQETKKNV